MWSAVLSASVTPATGAGSKLDAPPDRSTIKRSRRPSSAAMAQSLAAAAGQAIGNGVTGFRHDDPSRRHNMAVLDNDESALQPRSQSLFYRLGHRGRGLPGPEHDHTLIATQVIPAPADDQLLAVS